jgi:dihydroorotate dehydrogenase (fumarate)
VLTDLKLSDPSEIRLPLLWLAVLAGRTRASLAASTGVNSAEEVVKYLLVGADVVMTTSSLLRQGPGHMTTLLTGLEKWLDARGFTSLKHVRGIMSQRCLRDPQAFERANYIKILQGYQAPAMKAGGLRSIVR